jgi:dihydroorotase
MQTTLTMTRPDDWHVHLRDGDLLPETVRASAAAFNRVIVMPNLTPPVRTAADALAYRARIEGALASPGAITPLMTLYLTDETTPEIIAEAVAAGVTACKLYPAGATTNSDNGVSNPLQIYPVFEALQAHDMPLLLHGEVVDAEIDIFDREAVFIERYLTPIRRDFPELRIVLEHITTKDSVEWVQAQERQTAATVTPQHLMLNRNDLLVGGIRPHNYCLPILKRNTHQKALQDVVATGDSRFFLGTDSAPHAKNRKEADCGCAGCYSAAAALPIYATIFEDLGALDKLEGFASHHGPDFYGMPRNEATVTLKREAMTIPQVVSVSDTEIVPWQAGLTIPWSLAD